MGVASSPPSAGHVFQFATARLDDQRADEEEREHLVSLLAADDALELNGGKIGLVLAADLSESQLNGAAITLKFSQIASLLISEDGEELSWFAPEEIAHQIDGWL